MRKNVLKNLIVYIMIGVGLVLSSCSVGEKQEKPNIIFIMSDDHTSQAVGAYGDRFASLDPTPSIDRLADEGMLFRNVFCTNSICTPSRATIMTGQHSHSNGVLDLAGVLPPERHYLPQEMSKAGYQTAMVGKWHLTVEPKHYDYYKVLRVQGEYHNPVFREKGKGQWPENLVHTEGHSSDMITDASLEWLEKRDKSKPFFLMHHFKAPHDMFENAKRYDSYLEDADFPEPESMWSQPQFGSVATRGENDSMLDIIGSSIGKRNRIRNMGRHMEVDPNLPDDEYKREAYRRYMQRYFRCVKGVDDNVGRLFAYLEENGLMDNTIIIYTGDQGFYLGEHDYIDKRWMYEESMRMPFLVRYPEKIKPGSSNDWLINNTDFAPTMLALAGVKTPDQMQGHSFVSALEGKTEPADWRKSTYYRYWMHMAHDHLNPGHFGIRTKTHKLIFYYGSDFTDGAGTNFWRKDRQTKEMLRDGNRYWVNTPVAWELYDLENDPHEMVNQYNNPEYKEIVAELKAELKKKREEIGEIDAEQFPKLQKIIEANWDK